MTIYDIAKEAGVSISTVSRALNSPETVTKKNLERIQAVIRKYNFSPNAIARGLVSNSMRTIGILCSDIRRGQFANIAYTIESLFFDLGYNVILCNTGSTPEKKKKYIKILAEKKIDGLIILGSVFSGIDIEKEINRWLPDVPIVVTNGYLNTHNAHFVLVDHDYAMNQIINHLVEKQRRHIIMLTNTTSYNGKRKKDGFISAMQQNNLQYNSESIIQTEFGIEGTEKALSSINRYEVPIDGIVFIDDIAAIAGLNYLVKNGKSIPKDISLVGYDNSILSLYANPLLTTVDANETLQAKTAVEMVKSLIDNEEVGSTVIIRPKLIVRDST